MKSSSPFNEGRAIGVSTSYHKIGREEIPIKKRGERDIEDLVYGKIYKDQEEIDLCLNCPYPECKGVCDRIKKHRADRAERQSRNE